MKSFLVHPDITRFDCGRIVSFKNTLVVLEYGRVIENNCYSTDTIKIILEIKKNYLL
jgi:hypothetical protein